MADLDDLLAQIPTQEIAMKLGADEGEVASAIQTLIPVMVGGLQQNAQDPNQTQKIESAANNHAASGLLDGGVSVDQVDENDGQKAIAKIFGGNDNTQVAAAGQRRGDLLKRLLPILAPIVLAYIGKQLTGGGAAPAGGQTQTQAAGSGGLGDVLGSILGGASGGGGNNPLGSILGSVLGGNQGGSLGSILGGLLGGKK